MQTIIITTGFLTVAFIFVFSMLMVQEGKEYREQMATCGEDCPVSPYYDDDDYLLDYVIYGNLLGLY